MALLFIDSFDHYDNPHILAKWTSNWTPVAIAPGKGRCGSAAMQMYNVETLTKGIPFGSLTGTVGFAAQIQSDLTPTTGLADLCLLTGSFIQPHLRLRYRASDGSLAVVRRTGPADILGQTAPDLIRQDRWYFIEWQATIHPTAGAVTVRIDNVVVLAVSGVNTVGDDGVTPYPADLRSVGFGYNGDGGGKWLLDDVYILDSTGPAPQNTFLGDCRVEYLRPRADSTPQQWTPVGGTLTHWRNVDDNATPDDDGTYVEANAAGLTDQNVYMPTGLPAGPIFGAQLNLLAKKSEAGPRVIAPVVNGTPTAPSYAPSYETYQYFSTLYPTNPATGLPWTIAEINAAAFGVRVVS